MGSEAVTEKVKDGNILTDITSGATSIAGKVTDAVNKKSGFDLSSLWGSTRSEYLPCEDSGLMHQSSGGYGGYQDEANSGGFSGFGQDNRVASGGSEEWEDWTESGWSDDSPASSKQSKTGGKKKNSGKVKDEGSLIDFDNNSTKTKSKDDDGWNN